MDIYAFIYHLRTQCSDYTIYEANVRFQTSASYGRESRNDWGQQNGAIQKTPITIENNIGTIEKLIISSC